ncbi:CO(2)-response secreted protease [Benincasa hispida]|uniref:CO(2)-response secreted protease n=1 Tax=Benincasa hispida TaxID=102211 RepID=UPI0018FF178D|nr:CO(2)-response secreted protease [Benincasa hispida]
MQSISFCVFFVFVCVIFSLVSENAKIVTAAAEGPKNNGVYIVYMGSASASRTDFLRLLNSVHRRNGKAVVHTYKHGFTGFAAHLSEQEAQAMRQSPGVVSVFPDPILKLHTTHSWDFLVSQTSVKIDANPKSDSSPQPYDTIIGILDTGIWPESESFSDKGMSPIPSRWKGTCMVGDDFTSSNCNRKIIGARFYESSESDGIRFHSPRDGAGHGTHVASTAAGSAVANASYYGLAAGTAKGGSPGSRIAMYRVCVADGCHGSSIMAAFDDAIADGVDVLSLSLGAPSYFRPDLTADPIAIGAFHAVEKGITVVCSAGNDGPSSGSVVNDAPWIITVAASTIDRDFESDVVLGNKKVIKGEGINFSNLQKSPVYPLIQGKSAKKASASEDSARICSEDSMDETHVKGKIVICENSVEGGGSDWQDQAETVKNLGGVGVVLIDDNSKLVAEKFPSPMTVISKKDGAELLSYVTSSGNPVATILPTVTIINYKPAPAITYFSSRGPNPAVLNMIKPDISAPGVNILAAWLGNDSSSTPQATKSPLFNVISGTSMSCPHVSGVVAFVKSQNPTWSPSAIRSAIMTTAIQTNNLGSPMTLDTGSVATPYDYGAGEISTNGALQPGLVYETSTTDYLNYLCGRGYNRSTIKSISTTVPDEFDCPKNSTAYYISNMNYPTIAVSELKGKESKKVIRTVTNVGGDGEAVYTVSVDAPGEVDVKVIPEILKFGKNNEKQSYQVVFTSTVSTLNEVFGSITWTDGKHRVRSPFVVTSKSSES